MKKISVGIFFLMSLVLSGLVLFLAGRFLFLVLTADPKEQLLALGGLITIVAVLVTHVTTKNRDIATNNRNLEREVTARQFTEKKAAFSQFMLFLVTLPKKSKTITQKDILKEWDDFYPVAISWGGSDIIHGLVDFRQQIIAAADVIDDQPHLLFSIVEDLLRILRNELGHDSQTLRPMAIMKVILRDEDHDSLKSKENTNV